MQTELLIDDMSRQIAAVEPRKLSVYTAHVGLCELRAQVEAQAMTELLWQSCQGIVPPGDPTQAANKFSIFFRDGARDVAKLAAVECSISAIERDPDFAEAVAIVAPMVAERQKLRELAAAEKLAFQEAEEAAAQAHREAVEKAVAKAAADPKVIATREALAKLSEHPLAPVRGKITIRSHVAEAEA